MKVIAGVKDLVSLSLLGMKIIVYKRKFVHASETAETLRSKLRDKASESIKSCDSRYYEWVLSRLYAEKREFASKLMFALNQYTRRVL